MNTRPTISIAMVVALACAPMVVGQERSGSASRDEQLRRARTYHDSGRHYEASKIAKDLLEANASDAEAQALLDQSKGALRDLYQQKVEVARVTAAAEGATDADRLALADAYFEAGEYAAAADAYGKLPSSTVSGESRLRHARSLAWTSRYDAAERVYNEILKGGATPELRLEYGRLLSWMGASAASVKALTAAYETDPREDTAIALANSRAWSGNREAAIALLTDFTSRHPEATEARQLLTELETSAELRLERIDAMVDNDPYNLALRRERAVLLYDSGRYAGAMREIEFLRENAKEPIEGIDALYDQAKERREQEIARLDERRAALRSNAAMTSSTADGAGERLSLAKAYAGHAAYDQAIELYDEYLSTHPEDTDVRLQYARVLNWDRRYPAAQRQYATLLREMPDRADLEFEYAQTLSYDSEFVPALRTFRSLTDLSDHPRGHLYPDVPARAHYQQGQIYRWYGWNETAVEEQNRALALDDNYADAREELNLARLSRPSSAYGATYSYFEDSNDLQFRRVDVDGQHWVSPRTAFDASVGRHEFERGSDNASATSLSGGIRHRLQDRLTGRGRVGVNLYDQGVGTRPFWGVGVDWLPNIQTRTAFDYNHYDLVYDVFTLASLGSDVTSVPGREPLDIDDFRGRFDYQSGGFWSFLADGSYGMISDDNTRQALHGLLSFRLLRSPFVAVKADGRYLSYDFRSNRYWSPEEYRSLAGVLQVGGKFRDRLFWTLEGKAGKSYERDRSSDIRTFHARLTVPVTDLLDIVGNYSYGKSGRFDNVFDGSDTDFVNYWQRSFYVGVRMRRLFSNDDNRSGRGYYYDNRVLTGSPVIPPVGENR